ncbi:hypothetical protein AB0M46_01520 [Dactylosporangium sp. NPDC051485]|uniref:hypothetical protein n=1 Tax=Dactylosporangium sp. NPDC051485 TaxID=3154846 RepID=UPI00342DE2C8
MMPPQPQWPAPGEVPPPPRGPGVLAPFVSPPRDRDLRGLWISLVVGALVVVLCCVGGVVGVVLLVPYADGVAKKQVVSEVETYLVAVRDENFTVARRQLCAREQRTHSIGWFEDHYGSSPVIDYRVSADDVSIADTVTVVVRIEHTGGRWETQQYLMEQSGSRFEICGGID